MSAPPHQSAPGSVRFAIAVSAILGCVAAFVPGSTRAMQFTSVGASSGVSVTTTSNAFGNGASAVDVDGDGDLDLFVTDDAGAPNRFFRNDGSFSFTEVPTAMGAANPVEANQAVFADYDNDADQDCYLTLWGLPNRLYRNDGGTFVDATGPAGVGGGNLYTTGAAWGDVDRDGLLDLYVANRGLTEAGEPNQLFRAVGDGSFEEIAAAYAVDGHEMSFQPVLTDHDRDGDLDIYVANDKEMGNRLYRNDWPLPFADVSFATGTGLAMDGMGVGLGDANADGFVDFYVTNTYPGHRCLVSQGDGTFRERATEMAVTVNQIGWGALFFDGDLDGDEDLYTVNAIPFPNRLFRNDGGEPWVDVSVASGVEGNGSSYACLAADFDDDGDLDLYTSNVLSDCELYRNDGASGHWLQVAPVGTLSNRDGVGARVEIEVGGAVQFREIRAGSSYLAQMGSRACFGLGGAAIVDRLTVRWPSGLVEVWQTVAADQIVTVTEGTGTGAPEIGTAGPASPALRLSPNPFRGGLRFETELPEGPVMLRVVDVAGRLVRRAHLGPHAGGTFHGTWDGRNESGARLPGGVYWMELSGPGARRTARAIAAP